MDILHSAFIFRFVIGFAIACPFLIIPALASLFKKRSKAENIPETPDGHPLAHSGDEPRNAAPATRPAGREVSFGPRYSVTTKARGVAACHARSNIGKSTGTVFIQKTF